MTLSDQVALVTGAGSGIGKAIAYTLADHGAHVCLVGRTREKLEAVAAALNSGSGRALVAAADLTVDDAVQQLHRELHSGLGRLDILVLCAGTISHGKLQDAPIHDFDMQHDANVRAPYLLIQTLLPMLKASHGQVVFINSSVGLTARGNASQFSATQHALKAIADSLRDEVNADGIRVLSVFPGRTATPRQASLYQKEGAKYRPEVLLQPEDIASVVVNALTLPRTAEVTEIRIRPMLKSY